MCFSDFTGNKNNSKLKCQLGTSKGILIFPGLLSAKKIKENNFERKEKRT
jgi:hypothetical protein